MKGKTALIYFCFEAKQKIWLRNEAKRKIRKQNKVKKKIRSKRRSEKNNTEVKKEAERKILNIMTWKEKY